MIATTSRRDDPAGRGCGRTVFVSDRLARALSLSLSTTFSNGSNQANRYVPSTTIRHAQHSTANTESTESKKKKGTPKADPSPVHQGPLGVTDGIAFPQPPRGAHTSLDNDGDTNIGDDGSHGVALGLHRNGQETSVPTAGQINDQATEQGAKPQAQAQGGDLRTDATVQDDHMVVEDDEHQAQQFERQRQINLVDQANAARAASQTNAAHDQWVAEGKPACPQCGSKHPPPCDPRIREERDRMMALKQSDPQQWKIEHDKYQAERRSLKTEMRRKKLADTKRTEDAQQGDDPEVLKDAQPSGVPSTTRAQAKKKGRSNGFSAPWCKSCQLYHPFGQHLRTKKEAVELKNLQAQGRAPIPDRSLVEPSFLKVDTATEKQTKAEAAAAKIAEEERKEATQRQRHLDFMQILPEMFSGASEFAQQMLFNTMYTGNPNPAAYRAEKFTKELKQNQPAQQGSMGSQPTQPQTYAGTAYNVPSGAQFNFIPTEKPKSKTKANSKDGKNPSGNKPSGGNNNNKNNTDTGKPAGDTQPKTNFKAGTKLSLTSSGPLAPQEQAGQYTSSETFAPHKGGERPQGDQS
ncbi:hypothetical protein Q7P37_006501 [Cladosporium fusiforme]